jgi:hypothetical protein
MNVAGRVNAAGWSRLLSMVGVVMAAAMMTACASTRPEKNTLTVVRDRSESAAKRIKAVEQIREEQSAGARMGAIAPRDVYKEIAWTVMEPAKLRAAVVDSLLNDRDEKVVADAKEMAKLMLPKEAAREVVVAICKNAGTKGWTDFIPAIVRSYSRSLPGFSEEERVERKALVDLNPGKSLEQTVFDVFMNPPKVPPTEGIDWTMRYRADAWDVLARIDPDGTTRSGFLDAVQAVKGDVVLDGLRAAKADLRAVPITGEELTWLASLRSPQKKDNAAWWQRAAQAVAKVPASVTELRLRHIEAVRWAASNKPELLVMSRDTLVEAVGKRLAGRTMYQRSVKEVRAPGTVTKSELFEKRVSELSWGDLLSIEVIDEAIHQPQVVSALFAQSEADRADTSTEYGGLLAWKQSAAKDAAAEHAVVMVYMPRSAQRVSDTQFIASDDMIVASDLALAHYHFHVQKERNAEYAGPSAGDLQYAARFGRSCLVFTSVSDGVMAVDYYQSGDVVIDLGGYLRAK